MVKEKVPFKGVKVKKIFNIILVSPQMLDIHSEHVSNKKEKTVYSSITEEHGAKNQTLIQKKQNK